MASERPLHERLFRQIVPPRAGDDHYYDWLYAMLKSECESALEAAREEGRRQERERCLILANGERLTEVVAGDRARAAGRELVAECRQAGREVAERIHSRIAARGVR